MRSASSRLGSRIRRREKPPFRRRILFEALEPRLLLSADSASPALADALAASLNLNQDRQQETAQPLQDATPVLLSGALRAMADVTAHTWIIELDDGSRALQAAGGSDNLWRITGADEGTLNGAAFSGIGTLLGGADNIDTFILEPGGSLSGYLDGGPGGFDSMLIAGGSAQAVVYTATGPDSGFVQLGDNIVTYKGLEPITDNSDAVDRVLTTSAADDQMALSNDPAAGQFTLAADNGTFESVTFAAPSGSLTIDAGDGDDTLDLGGLGGLWAVIDHGGGSATITDGMQRIGASNVEQFTGARAILSDSDVAIPEAVKQAILDGLDQLVAVVQNLESSAPLDVTLPVIDKTLAEIVDLSGRVSDTVRQPVVDFFDAHPTPTVLDLLDGLGPQFARQRWDPATGVVEFDVDLRAMLSDSLPIKLGADADAAGPGVAPAAVPAKGLAG